jgi:methionyl aminopeptidase
MPNYGRRGRGKKFIEGMVVAIEPMTNLGTNKIRQHNDENNTSKIKIEEL